MSNKSTTLKVYTDACRLGGTYGCYHMSWAWVAILPDGDVIEPKYGRILKNRGQSKGQNAHDEEIPKALARKSLAGLGPLEIHTDHPVKTNPEEIACGKHDPWHLTCHYAALTASLKGERKILSSQKSAK